MYNLFNDMETNLICLDSESCEKDGLSYLLQKHWEDSQQLNSQSKETIDTQFEILLQKNIVNPITEQNQIDKLSLFLRDYIAEE